MTEQFIPWNTTKLWQEVNSSIDHLCRIHQSKLHLVNKQALKIHGLLESIFPEMDKLCGSTCVTCCETCCSVAKLWFDFKDLIFFHIAGINIPQAQPLDDYRGICRYKSASGCTLPRIGRPWICTRYLCHIQTAYLRKNDRELLGKFEMYLMEIKHLRNNIEDDFIHVTV